MKLYKKLCDLFGIDEGNESNTIKHVNIAYFIVMFGTILFLIGCFIICTFVWITEFVNIELPFKLGLYLIYISTGIVVIGGMSFILPLYIKMIIEIINGFSFPDKNPAEKTKQNKE